jgi:hypothetical protein
MSSSLLERVLVVIMSYASQLVGKKVCYRDVMPTLKMEGIFSGFKMKDGMFLVEWKYGERSMEVNFNPEFLSVAISDSEIKFGPDATASSFFTEGITIICAD